MLKNIFEDVAREIAKIQKVLDVGVGSYTLQYNVKCKMNLSMTKED